MKRLRHALEVRLIASIEHAKKGVFYRCKAVAKEIG
jgi:hypothetical protein